MIDKHLEARVFRCVYDPPGEARCFYEEQWQQSIHNCLRNLWPLTKTQSNSYKPTPAQTTKLRDGGGWGRAQAWVPLFTSLLLFGISGCLEYDRFSRCAIQQRVFCALFFFLLEDLIAGLDQIYLT